MKKMDSPAVLLYHKITYMPELGITRTTPFGFQRQIDFLAARDYKLKSLSELYLENGLNLPEEQKPGKSAFQDSSIGLTFDDGYRSVYSNALPVLLKHGFTSTVFIPSGFIGRNNDWDAGRFGIRFSHMELDELKAWITSGGEVGCHGASHTCLRFLKHDELRREIVDARHKLEDILGQAVKWFSPPFGLYDRHVLELVRDAGYTGIAVVNRKRNVQELPDIFIVSRQPVYLGDSRTLLATKLNPESRFYSLERFRQLLIHSGSLGTVAVQRIRRNRIQDSKDDKD